MTEATDSVKGITFNNVTCIVFSLCLCCWQMKEMQFRRRLLPSGSTLTCPECPVAYLTSTTTSEMDTCSPDCWRSSVGSCWWENTHTNTHTLVKVLGYTLNILKSNSFFGRITYSLFICFQKFLHFYSLWFSIYSSLSWFNLHWHLFYMQALYILSTRTQYFIKSPG